MFKVIRVELISTMFVNCFLFVAFIICSFFFCLPLYSCLSRFYLNILYYFIFSHFLVCGLCLFHFSLLVAPQFAIMNLSPLLYHPVSLHKVKVKSLSLSNTLQPHGLQPTRLLHLWDFPGKTTGVGCHFLLQGIFLTKGLNPGLPHCRQMLHSGSHQGCPGVPAQIV